MPEVQNIRHIGMRRAHALSNLSVDEQFDLIADGLPILMQNAGGLLEALKQLTAPGSAASRTAKQCGAYSLRCGVLLPMSRAMQEHGACKSVFASEGFASSMPLPLSALSPP